MTHMETLRSQRFHRVTCVARTPELVTKNSWPKSRSIKRIFRCCFKRFHGFHCTDLPPSRNKGPTSSWPKKSVWGMNIRDTVHLRMRDAFHDWCEVSEGTQFALLWLWCILGTFWCTLYISQEKICSFCQLRPKTSKLESTKNDYGIRFGFIRSREFSSKCFIYSYPYNFVGFSDFDSETYIQTCMFSKEAVKPTMPGVFGLLGLLMLFLGVVLCVFLRSCSASSRVCFRNPQSLETQTRLIDADILIWTFVRRTMMLV